MKTHSIFFLFFLNTCFCFGQSGRSEFKTNTNASALKKVEIGEKAPEILLSNLVNYTKKTLRFSELKGKLIILDFWNTGCSACIKYMPEMQKLQVKYAGRLQVIGVNYQRKDYVEKFFLRQKQITGMDIRLPEVCGDIKLTSYFKVQSYPHFVWIDQEGIVRYVTNVYDVNEENIEAVLSHKQISVTEKIDRDWAPLDINRPLFIGGNGGDGEAIICYSMLSGYVKDEPTSGAYYNSGDSNSTINAINWSVKGLFQMAFNDYLNNYQVPDNRTVLKVSDTTKYVWDIKGVVQTCNFHSYQLVAPYRSADSLKKMMQQDLMRYFGLEAHMEKRIMRCWVLSSEDTSLLISKGGEPENNIHAEKFTLNIINVPDSVIGLRFIYNIFYDSPYPFINEIHMHSHVDILLDKIDCYNQQAVMEALKNKYKLNIRLEDRSVDILVISDRGLSG